MKSLLALSAVVGLLAASGTASAASGEELIASNKCSKCHTATTTKKGPSFASIAEKYKGKPDPTPSIVDMLKTGGKDDHAKVTGSDADLKAIAAVVLSAK
jgi:cytochrome c551/c552